MSRGLGIAATRHEDETRDVAAPKRVMRAVVFADEEIDCVDAVRKALDSGADEVFVVSLARLFDSDAA